MRRRRKQSGQWKRARGTNSLRERAKVLYDSHRNRARKSGATLDYTASDLGKLAEGNPSCVYCDVPLTGFNLSFDHDVPVSRGGGFGFANLVPSCQTCNAAKHVLSHSHFRALIDLLKTWDEADRRSVLGRLRAGAAVFKGKLHW